MGGGGAVGGAWAELCRADREPGRELRCEVGRGLPCVGGGGEGARVGDGSLLLDELLVYVFIYDPLFS